MAYGNYLAAITDRDLENIIQNSEHVCDPYKLVMTSHGLPDWCSNKPLRESLVKILDGGKIINAKLEHPFRKPLYIKKDLIKKLHENLESALNDLEDSELWKPDLASIFEILEYASLNGLNIISVLDPPFDQERAVNVKIPFRTG